MIAHLQLHHANGWRLLDAAEYLAPHVTLYAWRIELVNLHNAHRIHVLYIAPDGATPSLAALDLRRRAESWLSENELGDGLPGTCDFRINAAAVARLLADTGEVGPVASVPATTPPVAPPVTPRDILADIILRVGEPELNHIDCRSHGHKYLIGQTHLGHGIALAWRDESNQMVTMSVLETIFDEAEAARVNKPIHIYAMGNTAPLSDDLYRFHQISNYPALVSILMRSAPPTVNQNLTVGRMPRDRAEAIARDVLNVLAPTCAQIEIAGSIRRGVETVKDAELVAIPTPETLRLLDEMTAAGTWTKSLYGDGSRKTHRWGPKYRGINVNGLRVEIFMTDPESWGYIYWLRTGPGDLNQTFMGSTARTPIRAQDGAIWYAPRWERRGDKKRWLAADPVRLAVGSEADFFALIGMDFVAPELREMANYARLAVDMQVVARLKMSPVLAADGLVQMGLFGGVQR